MGGRFPSLRRLRSDTRGISVIELGLCLPILAISLLGLIDVSGSYSAQMSLQQAAARSLERVQVTGVHGNFDYVKTEATAAAAAAGVPASQVQVITWLECNNIKQPATVLVCDGTQVAGKYVQVTITSTFDPYFPYSPVGQRRADGKVALTATSSVRYG